MKYYLFFSDFINLHVKPPLTFVMYDSFERDGASRFSIGCEIESVENAASPYKTDDLLKCSNDIKKPLHKCEGVRRRRRHTLPPMAVPSALLGLTSLFGMGRGEPQCNSHLIGL